MDIPVLDFDGKKIRDEKVSDFFQASPINNTLIWEVVTASLAALRQGTHKTKTRGEVRGGGKKPWKQKGTGRARAGSIRSPIWVGGGVAFGPSPRDYREQIPKKKKKRALQHIMSDKVHNKQVVLLDSVEVSKVSTSFINEKIHEIIENSSFASKAFPKKVSVKSNEKKKKVVLIADKTSKEILLSTKNIPWLSYVNVNHAGCLGFIL